MSIVHGGNNHRSTPNLHSILKYEPTQNINNNRYDTPSDIFQDYKATRGPSLAPTTEMGKHHDIIERSIDNRESLEIGKSL